MRCRCKTSAEVLSKADVILAVEQAFTQPPLLRMASSQTRCLRCLCLWEFGPSFGSPVVPLICLATGLSLRAVAAAGGGEKAGGDGLAADAAQPAGRGGVGR